MTIIHQPLTAETIELWPKRVAIFVDGWEAVLNALNHHIDGGDHG